MTNVQCLMESLFPPFQISMSVTNRYQAAAKCAQTIQEALLVHVIKGTPMIVVPTHVHKVGKECVMKTTFLVLNQSICCMYSKEPSQ